MEISTPWGIVGDSWRIDFCCKIPVWYALRCYFPFLGENICNLGELISNISDERETGTYKTKDQTGYTIKSMISSPNYPILSHFLYCSF